MNLARGVEFFEEAHEYYLKGRKLSGVTGLITKKLGYKMPQEYLEEHREEGTHVHKAVQRWIETGESGSVHPGVAWIIAHLIWLEQHRPEGAAADSSMPALHSEVLVSDFERYASAVDIVADYGNGVLSILDIKKGVFKREYVTWQLSVYRYFIERFTDYRVGLLACIALKDEEFYIIHPKQHELVEGLLYGGSTSGSTGGLPK